MERGPVIFHHRAGIPSSSQRNHGGESSSSTRSRSCCLSIAAVIVRLLRDEETELNLALAYRSERQPAVYWGHFVSSQ